MQFNNTFNNDNFKFNKTPFTLPMDISPKLSNRNFTIEIWSKFDNSRNPNDGTYYVFYTHGINKVGQNIALYILNGGLYLDFYGKSVYTKIPSLDNFNHYSVVWNNNGTNMIDSTTFYINGKKMTTNGAADINYTGKPMGAGSLTIGTSYYGTLKKLAVFNLSLIHI